MIEVVGSNGDRAEAETREDALFIARTFSDDHFRALPVQGRLRDLTFTFSVDGKHVRTVTAKALR